MKNLVNYTPSGSDVLIVKPQQDKTESGIYIPDESQDGYFEKERYEIISVGPEQKFVKIGDEIAIRFPPVESMEVGHLVIVDEEEYVQLRQNEILGKYGA